MLQNVKPNWNENDSTSDAYIQNKPTIPVQKNADWDESDSSDAGYILGNPTKEVNKGLDIKATLTSGNTVTNVSQLKVPTSLDGSYSFGAVQGNMNISGLNTTIYGSQGGTIYLTASDGINIVPRYSYVGVRYNGNSINTAGGFAIVGDNGKLPSSIIPSGGSDYDPMPSNYTFSAGHRYLIDYTARQNNYSHSFLIDTLTDGQEIEFHVLVTDPTEWLWNWGIEQWYFWVGSFRIGWLDSYHFPPLGLYKYKIKKVGQDTWLLNEFGQYIAYGEGIDNSDNKIVAVYADENAYIDSNYSPVIPLSNEYWTMPFGGYATPVSTGYANFGIYFHPACSNAEINFADNTYGLKNKYLHLFSRNPVCYVGSNTINNLVYLNTVNDRVTITFVGNSSSHVYMNSQSGDLFDNTTKNIYSKKIVRLTTWCQWEGSEWVRYFIKEEGGTNSTWYSTRSTLPNQTEND